MLETFTTTQDTETPERYRSRMMDIIKSVSIEPAPPAVTFIESEEAVKIEEDWSKCRSPSRAMRRRAMGHRQNVILKRTPAALMVGDICYCHPEIIRKLEERARQSIENRLDHLMMGAIMGNSGGFRI